MYRLKISPTRNSVSQICIDNFKVENITGGTPPTASEEGAYYAEVLSVNDYYAFGGQKPGRSYNSAEYRYGFNGMEQDNELKGQGNSYDFGARMYDARVGRWMSLDPEAKRYAHSSPYNFVLNSPINLIDPDGKLVRDPNGNIIFSKFGSPTWVWQGKPKVTHDPVTNEIIETGQGYYAQPGYVYRNDGTKVEVLLVTDKTVYQATRISIVKPNGVVHTYDPMLEEKKEGDATTNCTGTCFVDGIVVLSSLNVTDEFLEAEGYVPVEGEPKAGDVGIYRGKVDGKKGDDYTLHAETYEEGGTTVTDKGGITPTRIKLKPGVNYKDNVNSYSVYRKESKDVQLEVTGGDDESVQGLNILDEKSFKKLKKQIKSKIK